MVSRFSQKDFVERLLRSFWWLGSAQARIDFGNRLGGGVPLLGFIREKKAMSEVRPIKEWCKREVELYIVDFRGRERRFSELKDFSGSSPMAAVIEFAGVLDLPSPTILKITDGDEYVDPHDSNSPVLSWRVLYVAPGDWEKYFSPVSGESGGIQVTVVADGCACYNDKCDGDSWRIAFPEEFTLKDAEFDFSPASEEVMLIDIHRGTHEYITREGIRVMDQRTDRLKLFLEWLKQYAPSDEKATSSFEQWAWVTLNRLLKVTQHTWGDSTPVAIKGAQTLAGRKYFSFSELFGTDVKFEKRVRYKTSTWTLHQQRLPDGTMRNPFDPRYVVITD